MTQPDLKLSEGWVPVSFESPQYSISQYKSKEGTLSGVGKPDLTHTYTHMIIYSTTSIFTFLILPEIVWA